MTFQVKGAGRRSDKAVGHLQHHLRSGAPGAGGNGPALDPIPLAQGDYLSVLKLQVPSLLIAHRLRACGLLIAPQLYLVALGVDEFELLAHTLGAKGGMHVGVHLKPLGV